jgi:hypothetical protein
MAQKTKRGFLHRHPRWSIALLTSIFLVIGSYTAIYTNNYLTIFWRIGLCQWKAPLPNHIMVGCGGILPEDYRIGAPLLDLDPRITGAMRSADVLITGSSTAVDTFVLTPTDNQLDFYFRAKGLKYYIMAQDGASGFRFRKHLVDSLHLKPKIALMSTGDLEADVFRYTEHWVQDPDRRKMPIRFGYWAIKLQTYICEYPKPGSGMAARIYDHLERQYCHGYYTPNWMNLENGLLLIKYDRPPKKRTQLGPNDAATLGHIEMYWNRTRAILRSPTWNQSCLLFYDIPAPGSNYKVAQEIAKRAGRPVVLAIPTPEKDYWTYDASHMEIDTAARWTKEFLPLLDPQIDNCLKTHK